MKKTSNNLTTVLAIVIIAIIVIIISCLFASFLGNEFDEALSGLEATVNWEEVNVREDHSTNSEILASLEDGDLVTLTGNSYEFAGNGDATDSWTEVQLSNGTIGWVVTHSINWN